MYWALVTITTVGYGDVSPVNVSEVVVASLAVVIGSGSFAFFMNSVGVILADINKHSMAFQHQLDLANKYM